MLCELGEGHVAVVGALQKGPDRRSLEQDVWGALRVQLLTPKCLHVQGPDQTLVEHALQSARSRRPICRVQPWTSGC